MELQTERTQVIMTERFRGLSLESWRTLSSGYGGKNHCTGPQELLCKSLSRKHFTNGDVWRDGWKDRDLKIEAATNQAVCAIFPRNEIAATEFVRYALIHQRPEIMKQRYGGAQPNISQQIIRNVTIPVPPLPQQRKIAAVLGLVQRAIDQQERLITLTTDLKMALLHKLFTEGLRGEPQKQTEIGPVPESWEVVRLEDICTFVSGGAPS